MKLVYTRLLMVLGHVNSRELILNESKAAIHLQLAQQAFKSLHPRKDIHQQDEIMHVQASKHTNA